MTILCHGNLETLAIEQGRAPGKAGAMQVLYSLEDRVVLMVAKDADGYLLEPGLHRWAPACERREMSHNAAMAWAAEHGLKADPGLRAPGGGLF